MVECCPNASAWPAHMSSVVPRELENISPGASRRPSITTLNTPRGVLSMATISPPSGLRASCLALVQPGFGGARRRFDGIVMIEDCGHALLAQLPAQLGHRRRPLGETAATGADLVAQPLHQFSRSDLAGALRQRRR